MEIKFNKPFEVNKITFDKLRTQCDGIVATLEKDGKYYIKVWWMKYVSVVKKIINDNQT